MRVASGLLAFAALALFWLAFTQFDGAGAPPAGSPGSTGYEARMMRDAQRSVVLGLAGCFVLIGAFACHDRAGRAPTGPSSASGQDPPRPGA